MTITCPSAENSPVASPMSPVLEIDAVMNSTQNSQLASTSSVFKIDNLSPVASPMSPVFDIDAVMNSTENSPLASTSPAFTIIDDLMNTSNFSTPSNSNFCSPQHNSSPYDASNISSPIPVCSSTISETEETNCPNEVNFTKFDFLTTEEIKDIQMQLKMSETDKPTNYDKTFIIDE